MDKREVHSKGQALSKALTSNEPRENILNILRDLEKNVKPTEDLLRATQIGKIVNRVKGTQTFGPEVPKLASEIIHRWKEQINKQKTTSGTSTPNGNASPVPNSKATPIPASKPKSATPSSTVPPDKRNWKTDKVPKDDITDDSARNSCIGLIYDGLCVGSDLPMTKILDLAKQVERAAFNLPEVKGAVNQFYKEKMRSLFQNLRNKSNPKLRKRILSGEIAPARFVTMSHEEMKSKEQLEADRKMEKENMDKAMVAQEEKSISTHLECGKCHQKKVSYSQAQTRSADEPMTTFCECTNCGNRWKFS